VIQKGKTMAKQREIAIPTIQIDNERVIVTQWSFATGAETTWHCHEHDYVVVPQTTGKLLIETEEGDKVVQLEAGASYTRKKGVKHNVINHNDYEFVFVEIELK